MSIFTKPIGAISEVFGQIKGIGPEGWKAIAMTAGKKAAIGAAIGGGAGLAVGAFDRTPGNTLRSGFRGAIYGGVAGGLYGGYRGIRGAIHPPNIG